MISFVSIAIRALEFGKQFKPHPLSPSTHLCGPVHLKALNRRSAHSAQTSQSSIFLIYTEVVLPTVLAWIKERKGAPRHGINGFEVIAFVKVAAAAT